jgi:predicted nucleic acid-binding protein
MMLVVDTGPINLVEALAARDLSQAGIEARDLIRMAKLMLQCQDFPLGVADASVVIALAERLKASEVATPDQRHFRAGSPAHVTALKLFP